MECTLIMREGNITKWEREDLSDCIDKDKIYGKTKNIKNIGLWEKRMVGHDLPHHRISMIVGNENNGEVDQWCNLPKGSST